MRRIFNFSFPVIKSRIALIFDRQQKQNPNFNSNVDDSPWDTKVYDKEITQDIINKAQNKLRSAKDDYSRWEYDQICERVIRENTLRSNYDLRLARIYGGGLDIKHSLTGQQAPKEVYKLLRKEWFYELLDAYLKHTFFGVSLIEFAFHSDGEVARATQVERGFINTYDKLIRTPKDSLKRSGFSGLAVDDNRRDMHYSYLEPFQGLRYFELLLDNNVFAVGKALQLARIITHKSMNLAFWDSFNRGQVYKDFVYKTNRSDVKTANDILESVKAPNQQGCILRIWRVGKDEDIELQRENDYDGWQSYERFVLNLDKEISKAINSAAIDGEIEQQASTAEVRERSFNTSAIYTRELFSVMIQDRLIPFLYESSPFGINPYRRAKLADYTITFKPTDENISNEQAEQPTDSEKKSGDPNAV